MGLADYYAVRGRPLVWEGEDKADTRAAKRGAKQQWREQILDEIEDYYQSPDWTVTQRTGKRPHTNPDLDLQAWWMLWQTGSASFHTAFRAARASGRTLIARSPGVYVIA